MISRTPSLFIDLGFNQCYKNGQEICGDAFKFQKISSENRLIAVLSDGLGSGVKANILASMTATMALKFVAENTELIHAAEIIMSALPVCQIRKISYSTFTIVDTSPHAKTRVIEMGNPKFALIRNGESVDIACKTLQSSKYKDRILHIYDFDIEVGDRLVFFSDGISQAGLASKAYPAGWGRDGCVEYAQALLQRSENLSSHELASCLIREALRKEEAYVAKDDMTCAALYFRQPQKMLLFTGPPFDAERDNECANLLKEFSGDKVICGGTSAEIVSRELSRELTIDMKSGTPDLPPLAKMDGIDLVTEGIFTLTRTAQLLEAKKNTEPTSPAGQLMNYLLRNDIIEFLVGTRINEAHQDPNLPVDLEIRRNIIGRIAKALRQFYLKEVIIRYV